MDAIRHQAAADAEETPPAGVSPRTWRTVVGWARAADYALEGVAVVLIGAALVGFSLYAGRRALVSDLAEDYLRERGVEASIQVLDVDARGFIGRVRLGPERDPDFTAERVLVLLAAPPPPEGPYALRPRSILVSRPQLKARWKGEELSFGALDPLIDEALSRPPQEGAPSPRVAIENGALRLHTPYGLVRAGGSGVVENSRLVRLDLSLRPAVLNGRGFAAELRGGAARVRVNGPTADVRLDLAVSELQTGATELQDAVLRVEGRAPYPDLEARRLDGPLRLTLAAASRTAETGAAALSGVETRVTLDGAAAGLLERPAFRGAADGWLRTDRFKAEAADARDLRANLRLGRLDLARAAEGVSGSAAGRLELVSSAVAAGTARIGGLDAAVASSSLNFTVGAKGLSGRGPLQLTASAARLASGEASARSVRVAAASPAAVLSTRSDGLRLAGPIIAEVSAASGALPGAGSADRVRARILSDLRVASGRAAPVHGRLSAESLRFAAAAVPLAVTGAAAEFSGRAGPAGFAVSADLRGRGSLPAAAAQRIAAQAPVVGAEPAYAAALARALRSFDARAHDVRLASGPRGTRLTLAGPVRIDSGVARAELTPDGLVLADGSVRGGFRLALGGGGLPAAQATVSDLRTGPAGFSADVRLRTSLDLAIAQGALLEASGRAASRGGAFTFAAADCVRFSADVIELGENDVHDLSTRLCPAPRAELIRADAGGYRVRGRFDQASAAVPFLEAKLSAGAGLVEAAGGEAGLTAADIRIDQAEVQDAAAERRFHPAALTGAAALESGRWRADVNVLDKPEGARLAEVALQHAVVSGEGSVTIRADDVRFTPDGLQPHDLSPLAVGLLSAVEGAVDFEGALTWNPAGGTSRGVVSTDGLSFDSAAGRVVGLKTAITLSSLAPLVAPPGQTITAERVEAVAPLEGLRASIGLTPEAVQVQTASARMAGGELTLEPMTLALAEGRTLSGAVRLDDVDLGALIAETGLGEKVKLNAVVDGRIPFETGPAGTRIAGGELRSVRPGRLSIDRQVLTQVNADGAAAAEGPSGTAAPAQAAPPNAFQEWAYQALENLAYDDLSVSVDSRPGGRLGMVFSMKGRHDPPNPQQARIGLFDLLAGRAFEKRIPLPGGAPVNLTLDSSINFDELLQTYLDLQRARSLERSAPVQSEPAK